MKPQTLIIWCVLIIALVADLLVFGQDDDTTKTIEYIVTAASANLRAGAGTGFAIVETVTQGDSLLIYDETPETAGWLRIYREGQDDAYIADFLVERAPMRYYRVQWQNMIPSSSGA